MKGKTKHNIFRNLIIICSSLFLVAGLTGLIFSLTRSNSIKEDSFNKNTNSYVATQSQITSFTLKNNTDVTMTEAIENSMATDYSSQGIYITISTPKELYEFSYYCNEASTRDFYLRQNYKLLCNINYDEKYFEGNIETTATPFIPIAWDSTASPFSGVFDGQGYEISNLRFILLADIAGSSTSVATAYANMKYLGMFSNNAGTIRNLGLIQSSLTISVNISTMSTTGGVANLVGYNQGTVTNCFYKDLRDTIKYEIGIAAFGGYQVSGLVFENVGSVSNSYIAVSNVLNYTVNDYDLIAEVIAKNSGTVTNTYFYDSSIYKCTSSEIVYKENMFETNNYTAGKQLVGTYVASTEALRAAFESISGWYTFNSYPATVKDYLKTKINTPIHRGITISGTTATIQTVNDFLYMYELFNTDVHFATDLTYQITKDINLEDIPSSKYYYKRVISSTITGVLTKEGGNATVKLADGSTSTLPTIYNFSPVDKSRLVVTAGVDTYGLFPYISGEVSNLNVIPSTGTVDLTLIDQTSTNAKGIGVVTGYSEKGTIKNVNVYATFKYNTNVDLGEYYLGMLAGLVGGEGVVSSSTINGEINVSNVSTTVSESQSTFTGGIAIGGAVGYVTDTYGSLTNILNTAAIKVTPANDNTKYQIGGIVGAGYVMSFDSLENRGNVTIGSTATPNYSALYVSGIIGRLLGVTKQIDNLTNQAAINVSLDTDASINMVSGVLNADIVTLNQQNQITASNTAGNLVVSAYKGNDGKYLFRAGGISNAATITVTNEATNLYYTDVINVYTANGFDTKLSGVYNLNYSNINSTKTYITATAINMNDVKTYAPVVNVINGSNTTNYVDLFTVYNFKNVVYSTTSTLNTTTLSYGGVVKGYNINYEDVRNEGNMVFNINNSITATTFKVYGVLEEVSAGYRANTVFNGGNITITSDTNVTSTITNTYVSGICYANRSNFTEETYNEYNPLSSDFNYSLTGTLANVINNGNVSVNQLGAKTNGVNNINGHIRVAGITNVNESIISSAFNLGDVFLNSYSSNNKYLDCAGIATLGVGRFAQIKDSANNGTIKNINMSTNTCRVLSAGILARNNIKENNTSYTTTSTNTNPNSQGSIVFTINYGNVVAHNQKEVAINKTTYTEPYSNASGIVGVGLCNTINTVNYANVYGSENISGMFAAINFSQYANEVKETSKVYISNSINYGNIYIVAHRYSPAGIPIAMTYDDVLYIDDSSIKTTNLSEGKIITVSLNAYYGSCISLINYNNDTNAKYVNIRYLINMNSIASMVANEISVPSGVTGATQTMFSAKQNDKYLNSGVVYAPLNNVSSTAYIGLFSDDFMFRKAIEGRLTLDTTTNPTDSFLTDYFQFVGYSKVNETLLNSIGWTTIAYNDAAQRFAENLTALTKLMAEYDSISSTNYNSLLNNAFNTESWISNASPEIIKALLPDVLSSQNLAQLKAIISYLFYDSEYSNLITTELRQSVVDTIVSYIDNNNTDAQLVTILDGLMYPELLAKIVAESDADYTSIKNILVQNIDNLTKTQKLDLLNKYINWIDNNNYFTELFDSETYMPYYTTQKYNVLYELLSTLDTTTLGEIFTSLDSTSYSTSMALKYALDSLTATEKRALFHDIFYYSYSGLSSTYEEAITSLLSQMDDKNKSYAYYTQNEANYFSNYYFDSDDRYVETWNAIKDDENVQNYLLSRFGYVQDSLNNIHKGIYAKATEYRNTYQSNDRPNEATYTINNDGTVTTTFASGAYQIILLSDSPGQGAHSNFLIRNRFIYVPDNLVSDSYTYSTSGDGVKTYYYGPYVNAPSVYSTTTGNSSSTPTTATMWNDATKGGYTLKGFKLNANDNSVGSGTQTTRYVPLFVSLDESYIANLTGGSLGSSYFQFLWNDSGTNSAVLQWVSREITSSKPDNNKYVLKKDTTNGNYKTTLDDGVNPSGTTYYYRYYTYDSNGNATAHSLTPSQTYYYNYSTVGRTTHNGDINQKLIYNNVANNSSSWNANDVLWGYLSANVITGIYYIQSMWATHGAFMTAKNNYGVITTQYIDYSLDDLIAVDGYRTKGLSTGTSDDDEITIIKDLINNYLLDTDAGKLVLYKAIAKELKTDVYSNLAALWFCYSVYANSDDSNMTFVNDFLANVPTTTSSYNLVIDNSNTTLRTYLSNIFTTNILPSLSQIDQIIMYSADSRSNMKKILQFFYDKDVGYYTYKDELTELYDILETYSNDNYQIIYDYIKDNSAKSESELSSIISSATDNNINSYITDYNNLNNVTSVDSPSLSGYTLNNAKVELTNANHDGYYYSNRFVSKDGTNDYSISLTTEADSITEVVAMGSGTVTIGSDTFTVSNTLNAHKFETASGTTTITAGSNVYIYAINSYSGSSLTPTTYSNFDASTWTYGTSNQSINGVSFTSYVQSYNSGSVVSFKLLEAPTSVTVYASRVRNNYNGTSTYLYYSDNRYVTLASDAISETQLNIQNLNWVAGTTISLRLTTSSDVRGARIYGIKVNDTIYRFTSNITATRNGSEMYSSNLTSGSIFKYDSTNFDLIGTATSISGDLYYATNDTLLVTTNSNAKYLTYSLSSVTTATYFANNYYKNNYAKAIQGISSYESNEIELYAFDKQYENSTYNLKISGLSAMALPSGMILGKYTMNSDGTYGINIANASTDYGTSTSYDRKLTLAAGSTAASGSVSFTISSSAKLFVLAKATNSSSLGNLYVSNDSNTYGSYVNGSITTYEFELNAGTYYIYSSCALDIYAITVLLDTDLSPINSNYQNIATKGNKIITALEDIGYTSSNYANYKSYYTYLTRLAGYKANTNTNTYYDNEVLLFSATQSTDINLYNLFSNDVIVQILKQCGYKLDEVLGRATTSTSSGLISYIDIATAKSIINTLATANNSLAVEAINAAVLTSTTVADASTLERELVAAYVSTDFIPKLKNNSLTTTYMDDIIEAISSSYDFIKADDRISTTEFLALMQHLGVDVATDGYGIFALASSHGIENGTFIPDNIDLIEMDAKYKKLDGTNIIEITDDESPSWRDLTNASTSSNYDISNTNSVNYKVREEMKQLKLSISTTIFELDLVYNTTYSIYASEAQIDSANKTITYLVSSAYYNNLASRSSITIDNIEIAESATYVSNLGNITWVNDTDNKTLTFNNAIVVTAEDTTVSSSYTIIIKGIDISYTFAYYDTTYINTEGVETTTTDSINIPYYGATVRFKFTGTAFPKGFDLKNYFYIGRMASKSTAFATPTYWKYTSGISNNGIVDENGIAYISVDVLQSMPQGNKYFTLMFYGEDSVSRKSVQIIKNANTAAEITKFGYDGADLLSTITGTSKQASSKILFGRAFTYSELTDYNSDSFYLYDFAISDNATVTITATKTETNGLMTYTVTYVVTSESGKVTNTYKHVLTEVSPYSTNDVYAYLYRDGYTHAPYTEPFEGMPTTGTSSLTYTSGVANYAAVYFNRGYDYQYRIRYVLNNFYIVNRDNNFGASEETQANGSSILESYAGLTVSVTESQNPGTYAFNYVYTNTAEWQGGFEYVSAENMTYDPSKTYYIYDAGEYITVEEAGEEMSQELFDEYKSELFVAENISSTYTRTYTFPTLYVIKDYAINALVSRLTFLDESIVLGDTATVMAPGHPLIPTDSAGNVYDATYDQVGSVANKTGIEWTYNDAFTHNTGITIRTTSIDYTSSAADASVTDYYALGTVSDSDLTYYAPTFNIDDYAQIYKYTTLVKLSNYGTDVPDRSILTDHTNRFIYVPFNYTIGTTTATEVFLVQLQDGTNKWLNVYKSDYDGEDETKLVYTYTTDVNTSNAKTVDSGFAYDGKDYVISQLAGTTDSENISLYMDYIGNPAEGHFWYISYAVFSEYYLENGITDTNNDGQDDLGAVKYYHISIIDATNTIYFEVELYAPTDFDTEEVYLTIAENIYDTNNVYTSARQISAYAVQDYEYKAVNITSSEYQVGKYYIQNRDGTYSLSSGSFDSTEAYFERGDLSISKKYDTVNISTMTPEKFAAGEYYTYSEYTVASVTSETFETGKYYTYSDYKAIALSAAMFVANTYYTTTDGVNYTLAQTYDSAAQYYRKTPTYTLANEYSDGVTYYAKTNTYSLAETYVAGTQYYKKSASFGLVKYTLRYSLAVLPKGYFYFYLDLPTGFVAKCVTDMENQLSKQTQVVDGTSDQIKDVEEGSFVPYTSILTQTVALEIIVSKGSGADASAWAVSTSDLYTRQIEYVGNTWDEE